MPLMSILGEYEPPDLTDKETAARIKASGTVTELKSSPRVSTQAANEDAVEAGVKDSLAKERAALEKYVAIVSAPDYDPSTFSFHMLDYKSAKPVFTEEEVSYIENHLRRKEEEKAEPFSKDTVLPNFAPNFADRGTSTPFETPDAAPVTTIAAEPTSSMRPASHIQVPQTAFRSPNRWHKTNTVATKRGTQIRP